MRILLLEDDDLSGSELKIKLAKNGTNVEWTKSGEQAKTLADHEIFDVILLDLDLPDLSGHQVLCHLRKKDHPNQATPALIMTAFDSLYCKVQELNSGADDYIVKPCDLEEIQARILALTRRRHGSSSNKLTWGPIEMDLLFHTVLLDQEPVKLSTTEFSLLKKLLENQGRTLTKESLLQYLHGWEDETSSNIVEAHICNLRKKFEKNASCKDFIKTIRGVGYSIEKVA